MTLESNFYSDLTEKALAGEAVSRRQARNILFEPGVELLPLLDAAYRVRKHYFGNEVTIHILNNAQNGFCPEDCNYCAQSKNSKANIDAYRIKSDDEFLLEAKRAYQMGAYRHCLVFAGRGANAQKADQISRVVRMIKAKYPLSICVSAGIVDQNAAQKLKDAGVDRLNHNLNTSEENYPKICTTHTYQDRLTTLKAAKRAGLEVCSGLIIGMGESFDDLVDVAVELRKVRARSIPVNFLVPIEGNPLKETNLTPQYCLRVLCLFRFLNPDAEIRAAAGREGHLRGMEVMAFYPANSIFLDGYLNTKGSNASKTLRMIKDAGFSIKSDKALDQLLDENDKWTDFQVDGQSEIMKTASDLKFAQK